MHRHGVGDASRQSPDEAAEEANLIVHSPVLGMCCSQLWYTDNHHLAAPMLVFVIFAGCDVATYSYVANERLSQGAKRDERK